MNEIYCAVCKDKLANDSESCIGMTLTMILNNDNIDKNSIVYKEYKKVLDTFGKTEFNICWSCWIKSFGVKPINIKEI